MKKLGNKRLNLGKVTIQDLDIVKFRERNLANVHVMDIDEQKTVKSGSGTEVSGFTEIIIFCSPTT